MPRGKLTPKQKEIRDLIKRRPDLTVPDIASTLGVSTQAIYTQVSKMRKMGHLPKRTPQPDFPPQDPTPVEPTPAAANNGSVPIEAQIEGEIGSTRTRLEAIAQERSALDVEESELASRVSKLDAAHKALVG